MNQTSERKFLAALDICKSLSDFKYRPTKLTYQAIELFCEIGKNPGELLELCEKYSSKIANVCDIIYEYGISVDNWRVDCPLGFGIKYHCSVLSFFLNLERCQFEYFTDNFTTPEAIAELIQDWIGIDLQSLIKMQKHQHFYKLKIVSSVDIYERINETAFILAT